MRCAVSRKCKGSSKDAGDTLRPPEILEIYYQRWISGVEGGGSGINLFITTEETDLTLDSVYFRTRGIKLEQRVAHRYIGRLKTFTNNNEGPIVQVDSSLGREIRPDKTKQLDPNLNDDACIISYIDGDRKGYFTVREIPEKPPASFPSARPDKQ